MHIGIRWSAGAARAGLVVFAAAALSSCTTSRIIRYREPDARNQSMFPHRTVHKASVPFQFAKLAALRTDLDTVGVRGADGHRMTFRQYMDAYAVMAFVVIRRDTILYETYRGGLTDSTIHMSFSVAKSFLSALVGVALHDGAIRSLDDSITEYLPELRGRPAFAGVTIRHLLQMRSGLRFTKTGNGPLSDLRSDEARVYYTTNLQRWLAGAKRVDAPGSRWVYKDTDAELLGWVLSRATGRSVAAYTEEKLWRRIGTEHDATWHLDHRDGQEKTSSGFNAVARDYARFGRLFLNGGAWKGEQVIPAEWVARSVAIDTARREPEISTWWKMQHTLYWWHPIQAPAREFFADGSRGQRIYVDPRSQMIIVQLANDSRQDFPFRKIVAYLNGETWEYPRSIPALVRQAAMAFGADSVRPTFERLLAQERVNPAAFVITESAMSTLGSLLADDPKTRAAAIEVLEIVIERYPASAEAARARLRALTGSS